MRWFAFAGSPLASNFLMFSALLVPANFGSLRSTGSALYTLHLSLPWLGLGVSVLPLCDKAWPYWQCCRPIPSAGRRSCLGGGILRWSFALSGSHPLRARHMVRTQLFGTLCIGV